MYNTQKPEVIFFDWDGTIVENSDFVECLAKSLFKHFPIKEHSNIADFEKVIDMAFRGGLAAKDSVTYLYGKTDYNIDDILKFMIHGSHGFTPKVSTRAGVIDVIRDIHKKNIPMCIVSNRDGVSLKKEVDQLELTQYFDEVLSFDCIGKPKPQPDIIYHAMKLLKMEETLLSRCWLIGDTMSDIGCAINSGVIPFFVGTETEMTEECIEQIENKTVIKINHYQELSDIILNF